MNLNEIVVTLLPVVSLLVALLLSCNLLKLNLGRYSAALIINLGISSLCLSPFLSPLVFGKFLLDTPIIGERFTLSYFFFKLPILYERVPAYLLVCLLTLLALFFCELVVGTYMTSILLSLPFRRTLTFSFLTITITAVLTYSSLLILQGLIAV